ncbi:MAG: cytosine permease [Homoserinimonas sp.]|nr:cytosine permease [Homoserinimonas sp.]
MVDENNLADDGSESGGIQENEGEPTGPRRSTFTPPDSGAPKSPTGTSDDELADALFADFEKLAHTGAAHIVPPMPGAEDLIESEPVAEPVAESLAEPVTEPATPVSESSISEPSSPAAQIPEVPTGESTHSLVEEPTPIADSSRTAPSKPQRKSIPVAELATELGAQDGLSTLDALQKLELQLKLRQEDAAAFVAWQDSALKSGDPGAIAEVADARAEFQDILDPESVPFATTDPGRTEGGDSGGGDSGGSDSGGETPSAPIGESAGATLLQDPIYFQEPEATLPHPVAAPEAEEATHTFRIDDVLDSELLNAPAPMSAPISNLPPPPGHAEPAAGPQIPDLVAPELNVSTPSGEFKFEDLLAGNDVGPSDSVPTQLWLDPDESGSPESTLDPAGIIAEAGSPEDAAGRTGTAEKLAVAAMKTPRGFQVEQVGVEPTPVEQRAARAARGFWLWFAINSSVVSVVFGGAILSLGLSLRQALIATLAGVALSFLPLGLGALAGKWSSQPTMVVSRAAFGHVGNALPSLLALAIRVFWGALLLWFLAAGSARILAGAELDFGLGEGLLTFIFVGLGFVLALLVSTFGYGLLARLQMVVTVGSSLLLIGFIVITWPMVDLEQALTIPDGSWMLVVTGAILVFSFVGLAWAVSSSDLARYQRSGSSAVTTVLWSTFGATIPAFVLIAYGALLAASSPDTAKGLIESPLDTIALMIPIWYPAPLLAFLALGLLSGVALSMYSGGLALQSLGGSIRRPVGAALIAILIGAVGALFAASGADLIELLRDVATSLAVPVAAWAGIFGAEMMIRNKHFDSASLVKPGGIYPSVIWRNLVALLVASAIGFGLTSASVGWLSWQGYLLPYLGGTSDLASSDVGVLVAMAIGLLAPIILGIPAIRRQEAGGVSKPKAERKPKAPKPPKTPAPGGA